jgi:hypothetical protein
MSGPEWIELLNLIPDDQHCQLNVMCRSGVELSIDAIMRTERSFLVYRGRVVGTTDDGRVFFTPYSEITSLYLNRFVKENEVDALFDFDGLPPQAAPPSAESQNAEDESAFVATPTAVVPPPPAAPLVFPPIGKAGSGLVPRVTPGSAAPPPQKPQHSSGKVPIVATGTPAAHAPIPKSPTFVPPPPSTANHDAATKGSILDRLRAQRSGPATRKPGS